MRATIVKQLEYAMHLTCTIIKPSEKLAIEIMAAGY